MSIKFHRTFGSMRLGTTAGQRGSGISRLSGGEASPAEAKELFPLKLQFRQGRKKEALQEEGGEEEGQR